MKRIIAILLCIMLMPLNLPTAANAAEVKELRVVTDRFEGTEGSKISGWEHIKKTFYYAADPTGAENSVAKLNTSENKAALRRDLGNIGNGTYYFGDIKIKFRLYKESGSDFAVWLRQYNPTSDTDKEGGNLFTVDVTATETGKWYDAILTVRKSGTYDFELKDGNSIVASSNNVEFNNDITGFWQLDLALKRNTTGVWYVDDFFIYINEETGFDNETGLKEILGDDFSGTVGENREGWEYSQTVSTARYVCEPDPKNSEETVLKLNRNETGSSNRVKMYRYIAGGKENAITDDMLITFRAYDEDGTGQFNMVLRAPDADGEGSGILTVRLGKVCTPGIWYDCFVELKNSADGESAVWSMWMMSGDEKITVYKNESITNNGVCRLDLEANYDKIGDWYIDDLKIYTDHRSELLSAAEELSFEDIAAGNLQEEVLSDLNLTDKIEYNGKTYPVLWKSSDENFITDSGTVNRLSFSKEIILTARVCKSDDTGVYVEKEIPVTVYKNGDSTDEKIIEDYINHYLKESLFTDEKPTALTNNLKSALPTEGPEGMTISWLSGNDAIKTDGTVTRPPYGNGNTEVILTATLGLNGKTGTKELVYTVLERPDPYIDINATIANLSYELLSSEDSGQITKDLYLPTKGEGNAVIEWELKEPTEAVVLDLENECGRVVRGDSEEEVTLIATVSNDGESDNTTEFTFTVLPKLEKIIETDMLQFISDFEDTPEITENFELTTVGATYGTKFTWEVTPDSKYIVIDGNEAIIYSPPFDVGDVEVNLVLTATYGGTERNFTYPVIIGCEGTNAEIVGAAKSEMADFSAISSEQSDNVTQNLALVTEKNGVNISWTLTSGTEGVVSLSDGEITRPLVGEEAEDITLTATFNRGDVTDTQSYTFTVAPFESDAEVLAAAMNALRPSQLSREDLKELTQNLTLPQNGKYGVGISWSSDSVSLVVNGEKGIVNRPSVGKPNAMAELTATFTYNGISDYKVYVVEILKKNYDETALWEENFDNWDAENGKTKDENNKVVASWKRENNVELSLGIDPKNSGNNVLKIDRTGLSGSHYVYASATNAVSGIVRMGLRFLLPENSTMQIRGRTEDCDQASVSIKSDNATVVVEATGYTLNVPEEAQFKSDDWNKLELIIDVENERYTVKLNDVQLTPYEEDDDSDSVTEDGESIDLSNGIPYNYYGKGRTTTIKSFRMTFPADKITYIDDAYMKNTIEYTNAQLNLADSWESDFLAKNDINALKNTLVFPDVWADGIRVFYYSENSEILDTAGMIQLAAGEADVIFKVGFSDGFTEYMKSYKIHVIKTEEIILSDEEAAEADLKAAVDTIKASGMLNNLSSNITIPSSLGKNGSTISVTGFNSALNSSGVITQAATPQSVTLTVSAIKNGCCTKTESISITVAAKTSTGTGTVTGSTSSGSGGDGGIKVTYGEQTKGDTGIDITEPDENTANTQFKDLAQEHWAYDEINYLVNAGIMNGTGDGMMEPGRTIRREEFIKLLVSAMGITSEDAESGFSDVDKNAWYAPYIAAAKKSGLVTGFEDGTVGIGKEISRQDMAVMIFRATELTQSGDDDLFGDDEVISSYAKTAVYTLRDNGVINGKDNGNFAPTATATRAETACMLYRAINKDLFN